MLYGRIEVQAATLPSGNYRPGSGESSSSHVDATLSVSLMAAPHPLASYPIALLNLIGKGAGAEQDPLLGYATRIGMLSSQFNVAAHRLLKAILEYSPSPSAVASEFLVELKKCGVAVVIEMGDVHSFFRL